MFKRRYLWFVSAALLTLAAQAQDVVESSRGETTEKQLSSDEPLRPWTHDPNLLTRDRLSSAINVGIEQHSDNGIAPGHRMIGEEDDRLPARRNLNRAGNHALAGQLPLQPRGLTLQRNARESNPDSITVSGDRPRRCSERVEVGKPVVSWAA